MSADEATLGDVLREAWRAKFFIIAFSLSGFCAAAFWTAVATPYYKAQMIVSPASPMNGAEVSSLMANDNLFALRFLMQRVGTSNSSDFLRFENIYDGPRVAALLLDDPKIIEGLRRDERFKGATAELFSEYLQKRVDLEPVGGSPLRKLVYWHPDRNFSAYLLKQLHAASDALIRRTIREETEGRIAHLQKAVAETQNPEHRRVLTTLLLEQERLRMLVSIEQSYAAAVIEPASASARPLWPDAKLLLTLFSLAGAILGFAAHSLRRPRDRQKGPVSARRWFRKDSRNNNERKKILSDAA